MGSRASRFWSRQRSENNQMSEEESGRADGTNIASSDDDEDPALAMVLAFILRNGHLDLMSSRSMRSRDSDDDNDAHAELSHRSNQLQRNTIRDNDLYQEMQLSTGSINPQCKSISDRQYNISHVLRQREASCCGLNRKKNFTNGTCASVFSRHVPNDVIKRVSFHEKLFCGTYSDDGNTFLSACQDRTLRIYNTRKLSNKSMFKRIQARDIGWSVLDTAFSSDSRFVAYSSWSNYIHVCSVYDGDDPSLSVHSAHDLEPNHYNFAVFSLQFSNDASEIICAANDGYLYVYNLERGERTLKLDAHEDDVNAICYADNRSHIIYSGGDDGLVKVWDRRILSDTTNASVGTLAGHQDGITYIDTRGDSRYLLSNSKDQSAKLWDIRQFSSRSTIDKVRQTVAEQRWDYRWESAPLCLTRKKPIPGDSSVMTYLGHHVRSTLIRARFSPMHTTGNKYIYSGCSSGRVFVYDLLTGEVVSKLKKHEGCVRDVSWHPYENEFITSSWDKSFGLWMWKNENVDMA
ncbi:unnamed protein product [Clavelina lepadiformis]|uniref:DDB1- and CUL4-associated factor 11 n=1 Tax=Clavelina lepadiformis TaxID=159417 RepID=A0ABP0F7H1_CLALP